MYNYFLENKLVDYIENDIYVEIKKENPKIVK